ncbi:MAG TPA: PKD-like domain-containing protein [Cyclobacteriaceae bacterium]|nr:PKD-like domain-containing protein [Cyclobacteriaceae bacterium]
MVNTTINTDLTAVAATTYDISVNANGLIFSGTTPSGGLGKLANELTDDKWTNTGLNPVNVVYTITPISSQSCSGDLFTITVTVRPEPVGANSTTTLCSDVVLGLTMTTSATAVAAANYTIAVNPNGLVQSAGSNSAGSNKLANELADDVWRNTGLNPVNVVYTITPISAAGCSGNDFTVTVTVNPEPVGNNSTTTVCANSQVNVTLSTNPASVAAATYDIAINPNGLILAAGTPSGGTGKLANEILDDVWANTGLGPVNVIYTITPVSAGPASCSGDPFTVTVTVNPQPVGSNVTATRCSDALVGVTLTTSVTAVSASSYNITTANGGLTQVAGTVSQGNGKAANELADDVWRNTGLNPVDVVYTVRPVSAAGCIGDPFTITITVDPEPVGANSTITKCSDDVVGVVLTTNAASVAAATYTIAVNANGLILSAGTASAGLGKAANELADDVWRNTGLNPVDVIYSITPVTAALCEGNVFTVTVTVNPEPVGSNSTASKCSDEVLGINLTTSATAVAAANYTIAVNANGLLQVGGTSSAGAGKAASEIADDVWRNTTNAPVNVVYTITPMTGAPCAGDSFTVTVTINPEPIGVAQTPTRCSDELVAVTLGVTGASVAAATYDISIVANGLTFNGTTSSSGTGKLANELMDDKWTNTGLTPVNVEYTIIPVSGTLCQGDPFTVIITVNPEPVGANSTAARCSDDAVNLPLSTSGTAVAAATYDIVINPNGLVFSGTTPSAGSGKLANELLDDRWTNDGLIPVNVIYTITPVSAAGCPGDPFTVNVTVRPEPVGFDTPITVCSDQAVGFTLSTNGSSVAAQSYTISVNANGLIQSAGTNSAGANKGVSELVADAWRNTGTVPVDVIYTITPVTAAPALCPGDPFIVTVTVNPEPVGASVVTDKCSDEVFNIILTTSGSSVATDSYHIAVNSNGLVQSAGTPSVGLNMAANEIADDAWHNITTAPVNVVYTITPVSAAPESCEGNAFTITVAINPEPVGQSVTVTDCSTTLNYNIQTDNINLLGNSLPSVFTYTVVSTDEIAVPTPPALDRVVATSDPITDSFTNTSSAAVDVTYTITPFNAVAPLCGGTTFTYKVKISPKPVGVSSTKAAVCSDVAFDFDPQNDLSPSVASSFVWTVAYDPGIVVKIGKTPKTGNIAETLTNSTAVVHNAVYTVIPTASGSSCIGDPFTITVPINPEPVVASGLDVTQCSDLTFGSSLATTGSSAPAVNYDITALVEAGLTGSPTTGTTLAANALAGDAFTNLNAAQLRVTYTVIPRAATGCLGDAKDVIFKINPEPVLASLIIPDICSSNINNASSTNIVLGTNGTSINATNYRLDVLEYRYVGDPAYAAGAPVGFSFPPSNKVITNSGDANVVKTDAFTNTSNRTVEVKYTFTPSSGLSCLGDAMDFVIKVNPQPTLNPALNPADVCSEVISSVTLSVNPAPPSIAANNYIIRSISFSGLIAGASNAGSGAGKPANAIFNDVYTNTTSGQLPATYSIAPVSGSGCVGPDQDVVLRVNPSPNLQVANAITCNGQISGISFAADPSGIAATSYDFVSVAAEPGLTAAGTNVVAPANGVAAGFIQNDRFTNADLVTHKVIYTIRPVAASTCKGPAELVELTVEPIIQVVPISANPNICGDSFAQTAITLTSGSIPSAGPISFNFTAAVAPAGQVTGFTSTASSLPINYVVDDKPSNNSNIVKTLTYTIIPRALGARNGLGCDGTFVPVVITVQPRPRVTAPTTKNICENDDVNITLTSPTVPSSGAASLFFDMTSVVTGAIVGASPAGSFVNGATMHEVLVNNDPANSTVAYTFTPKFTDAGTFGTCIGADVVTLVSVAHRPRIVPIPDFSICHGEIFDPIDIVVDTDPLSTFINWTVSTDPAVKGSNGAGSTFSQVLFNKSADPVTLTYTLQASNIGNVPACIGPSIPLKVTVYPEPKLKPIAPDNVCNNETINVTLESTANGTTYIWAAPDRSDPALPVIGPGSGSVINQMFVNNTESLGNYQYRITPSVIIPASGGKECIGTDGFMIINVAPPIVGQLYSSDGDNTAFVCKGARDFMFFDFAGLPLFEYTYSDGVNPPKTVGGKGPIDIVTVTPAVTTTYTLLSVKDGFGCVANPTGQQVTVNVGVTDATFSVDGPAIACSPYQVKFKHDEVAGVNYTWKWFDGVPDSAYLAASNVSGQLVPHTFFNPSPSGNVRYKVYLESSLDANYPGGCLKSTFQEVRVYPTISTGVFPDKSVICSDETVTFVNSSQGVSTHRWFYRVAGSATELDVKSTSNVSFKMPNTSSSNPITYEVVYQSTNGNCPALDVITPIEVYRGVDAHFSHTVPTVFVGGHSTVTFTNDSAPVDVADFKYEWEFGLNATPEGGLGAGPFNLDYTTPGPKEIVLVATNVLADAAGLSCADQFREIIQIVVPPLIADFTAIPLEACFPTDITITENKATGDKFAWRVIDNAGTAAQSNADLPVFKIPSPGKYTIELVTSNSFTGDQKTATKDIIIYNLPMASFDVRPGVVYVPDTELTTYNFSDGATSYLWDFDDGTTSDDKEPTHKYRIEGVYDIMLIAMNDHGNNIVCVDTLIRKVTAKQGGVTRVPNAFTPSPNGPTSSIGSPPTPGSNSFNDTFLPQVKGAEEFNMQVFDRWGNLVFESNNSNIGWDGYDKHGKLMPAGVYVFKMTLRLSDGQRTTQVGDITMIR